MEKEERELDRQRAKMMYTDRKSIAEFAESEVLKVKATLEGAILYVDWSNNSLDQGNSSNPIHCTPD